MKRAIAYSKQALMITLVMTVLLGGVLPLVFTVVAQLLFPTATHGSLIVKNDHTIGSTLIGQEFKAERYFWSRPSATTPAYNGGASGASNLSMGNGALLERANERMAHFPTGKKIPLSLVTSSGSGLDPHITLPAAYFQASRVAKARHMEVAKINQLIDAHTESPHLGFIGMTRVNVLALNLALDGIK